MKFEIIDFHTHPFTENINNICAHKEYCNMSPENTMRDMKELGISKICGSVLCMSKDYENDWQAVKASNECALELKKLYGDFYVPGFHIHPDYLKESCEEIERMSSLGLKLVGELVPYLHGWESYTTKNLDEIIDLATQHNMIVSFHSQGEDEMDELVKKHPKTVFVAAHPGEYGEFARHMERMKMSENYYLDVSGYGIFRHGMLRHAIDLFGAERFLFGSDYPTCNPAMYIGSVLLDNLITDSEKELVLAKNAKRILDL